MQRYSNKGGDSGVHSYECGESFIRVRFTKGGQYLYDNNKPGAVHVDKMKLLAQKGEGLNSYISKYVKSNYAKKEA